MSCSINTSAVGCVLAETMIMIIAEWPLVWKTWKCRGIWNMSGKCQELC